MGLGFLEDDVHTVGTKKASQYLNDPQLLEYLCTVIIVILLLLDINMHGWIQIRLAYFNYGCVSQRYTFT